MERTGDRRERSQGRPKTTARPSAASVGDQGQPVELRGTAVGATARLPKPECQECPVLRAWRRAELYLTVGEAARAQHHDGPAVPTPVSPHALTPEDPREWWRLSPREREVAQLLAEGLSDREIASRLRVTVETARDYSWQVVAKLGLRSRRHVPYPPQANAHGRLPVVERP